MIDNKVENKDGNGQEEENKDVLKKNELGTYKGDKGEERSQMK